MKKFQVFVSSTYLDLKDERQAVSQNILELNHIPVGMEFFGAADTEQMEFIKDEIRNSDYYVLIIGGKYGSVDGVSGKSYTQLEYEFANEIGIPVLVFLRKDRHELPADQRETDGQRMSMLDAFIEMASGAKRIRDEWETLSELVTKSGNALNKEINRTASKAVGWVRSDRALSIDAREKIFELEKELEDIRSKTFKPILEASDDPQSIFDAITQTSERIADNETTDVEKVKLRAAALSHLKLQVELGLNGDVPANLSFNSGIAASRLDMDLISLKLFTIAYYSQPLASHRLAVLHKQAETGSLFDVTGELGQLKLVKSSLTPNEISQEAFSEALLLAADAGAVQCEIAYSQAWNIGQERRENDGMEQLLAVLAASRSARLQVEQPAWLPISIGEIASFEGFDWKQQAGRTVPSYLLSKMAQSVSFISFVGWREVFLELLAEGLVIHRDESPMATWSSHFRRDVLSLAGRTNLLGEVDDLIQVHHGSNIDEFASLIQ